MISPKLAKLISYLPDSIVRKISKKILKRYLDEYANIKVEGLENLNDIKKPILFISNHLSNADALIIDDILKEQDITFVAGIKLSKNPLTNLGLKITKTITIKPNTADKEAISNIIKTLKGGNNVLIFPEGTRSRNGSLIEGKKGVILIQKLSKATVIPMSLTGTEKLLPINNKDMGAEKFNHSDIHVKIGKPLDKISSRQKGENKHDYEERVLEYFMKSIAKLLPEEYQGVYKIN
ncbi:lysophospholipid acyltransferase family protein [Clostridium tetani]|uniref:1-acyl-sn-glycerol-3-phosphate acyltransferase n=1 Tax=Clostridium tetani TaxID=1513 RepID=A0ABY0EWP4_CLOTA|nr:lysophospholipid acyltransferase family protein [Clostridium tetani]CDI48412.1 1-acyl-sn-glycerol-3-phosphate acyltransferase [Clostridium tetani 12124569]KHO40167.1 acyl-phosphate glycerol 3-phosphate acyltransferase [Clostridium tetani]RXI40997.1 1-acyl-sn-glycerol-3-phosphate acyltransferase [Clostridium tetani]RXI58586.1 1-acyl-sn-glycerol-3-phosphate acyltransferase [Clostridium tetani]RXI73298.1 1-acyl-sn-glycerol-3-phosphate acyltransferase [Clostridium tetani]